MNPVPDSEKTKEQLIAELEVLRAQVSGLQQAGHSQPVPVPTADETGPSPGWTTVQGNITEPKRTTEEALRTSEERFRLLVESVKDYAIFMLDDRGRIISWNAGAERIKGYRTEEVLGQHFSIFYCPEDIDRGKPKQELEIATAVGRCEDEGVRLRKDGSQFWANVVITALRDEAGNLRGFAKVTRDITERKQAQDVLRQSEEFFRSLSACSPVGIFLTDIEGRCTYVNPRCQAISGFTLEESLGEGWLQFIYPEDRERSFQEWSTCARKGQEYSGEIRCQTREGIVRWVRVCSSPMFSPAGKLIGYVGTVEDISARKQAEAEAQKLIREQAARVEAEAAQQQAAFLASSSALLASSLDYETTLKSVASLAVPYLADWCLVDLLQEDGSIRRLPIVHANSSKVELARQLQEYIPDPNSDHPIAKVLRSGRSELIPSLPDSLLIAATRDAEHLRIVRTLGMKSVAIVPLVARQRIMGTLAFVTAESERCYTAAHLAVAEELVHRAALAIDNARLYQEAQRSQQAAERAATRTARLQAITAALCESLTPQQVVEVIVGQGVAALGASSGLVALLNENGTELEIVAAVGFEQELADAWRRFPIDTPAPLCEAVRTRKTIWEESSEKRKARYPQFAESYARYNHGTWLSLPLIVEGRAVGGMTVSFIEVQSLSQDDRAFILALAQQCAQALDRARSYEAERTARAVSEAALSAAEEANRIKDQFLAIVSHELRTPLNAILGWAQMLCNRKLDEATMAKAFEIIERNARSQNQLIDDLLDVSRIVRGQVSLDIRSVNLVSVIEAAIEAVRLGAEAKNIRVQTKLGSSACLVLGDSERLQQVVWNLLSNAVKFTPEGGRIALQLQRCGLDAEIQVIDTGTGINPDFLPHVFEHFRQADGTISRSHGGLGLGLAIVRHLVELHGGTVRAESPGKGQGATFTVKLPLLKDDHARMKAELTSASSFAPYLSSLNLEGLQVLVVDDEVDTRDFLSFMLGQYGIEVTTAASAQEALQILEHLQPDILISDIGMPREDGYMLIHKLKALESTRGRKIPAIALTAYAREEDKKQALAAGFQIHVSKPVAVVDFARAIASLVGRTGQVELSQ